MAFDAIASQAAGAYSQALTRAADAAAQAPRPQGETGEAGFAGFLKAQVQDAIATSRSAEQQSVQAAAGRADIVNVVTAVTEAETTLQTVVAVRDRVIQAYQEIMRMPI
ncbi:flagellar hook-basal body complex protein FliE [Zavarzinia sp. CC-PAN008]|uniref:flagellar hook-basal body complex protein FliE n=1 Tax=Zavarzinia sp. CC-PAN008 TaxID=3243332 RepID=UPI003F743925